MLRAQRRRETEGGWADMLEELLAKVLELLEAAGRQQGGLGSLRPPPRCDWFALGGRPCTMRW